MQEFFNRPYPFNSNIKHNVKVIIGISFGLFLFLLFFEPFGLDSVAEEKKTFSIAGFGIITAMVLTLNLLIIPSVLPFLFKEEKWKIKKEIFWNLWILITLCGGYFGFSFVSDWFEMDMVSIFKISILSTVPITVLITINQDRLLKIKLRYALELNKLLQKGEKIESAPEKEKVTLVSESGKDIFKVDPNDLLFIRSAGNYVEVFWKDFEVVRKVLLRSSLQNIEESLKEHSNIFKCHRTCLVNIDNISKLARSSQSYKVVFDNVEDVLPVSRNYSRQLQQLLKERKSALST